MSKYSPLSSGRREPGYTSLGTAGALSYKYGEGEGTVSPDDVCGKWPFSSPYFDSQVSNGDYLRMLVNHCGYQHTSVVSYLEASHQGIG